MNHKNPVKPVKLLLGVCALSAWSTFAAHAQDTAAPAPVLDTGNTAWMLVSTALVLMMSIPGLALFYGGMVRKKNVLATVMQTFAVTCLVTVLWFLVGYSLAFSDGGGMQAYLGGFSKVLHHGIGVATLWPVGNAPEFVFNNLFSIAASELSAPRWLIVKDSLVDGAMVA